MKVSHGTIRDLLFLLLVVYFAQGALYTSGAIISQSVLFVIFLISIFYFFKILLIQKKTLFLFFWILFFLLNVAGYFFTADFSNTRQFGMFKRVLMFSLPFFPFYFFSIKGHLKSNHLIRFFFFLLPIMVLQYYHSINKAMIERELEDDSIVSNVAYSFVGLLPFPFLFRHKKILSYVSILIIMIYIIQGAKRGAMICGAVSTLIFIYYQLRTIESRHKWKGYLIVFFSTVFLFYFTYDFYLNNEYLIYRMEKLSEGDGTSGRDTIYLTLWNILFSTENIINIILGYGFASSLTLVGNFAHNDWLELLCNFGLIGIFIYFGLFFTSFKYLLNFSWKIDKKLLLLMILLIWIVTSLISMGYTSRSGCIQAILLAYLIGSPYKNIS